ncbi:MAG: hypothetical protein JO235_15475 [Chroococcidiopsidaceae cyanobacterium CP_BM_RX_35]|nr:hypothetical protein [Chroococcidiopsidaceae cyanobacterium CP_BM_RX_35]
MSIALAIRAVGVAYLGRRRTEVYKLRGKSLLMQVLKLVDQKYVKPGFLTQIVRLPVVVC